MANYHHVSGLSLRTIERSITLPLLFPPIPLLRRPVGGIGGAQNKLTMFWPGAIGPLLRFGGRYVDNS